MGPDEFSDPIVIPITLTIPNPVRRRHSGRFDLGPAHHPSFTDPTWITRHYGHVLPPLDRVAEPVPPSPEGIELRRPVAPGYGLGAMPAAPTPAEIAQAVARARRRAHYAEEEIARGEYGSALGHLLRGQPFPAEVDDGFVVDHDTLDESIEKTEESLEQRLRGPLDERHREDARNDIAGKPVIDSRGRTRWHDEEVATNANGLEDEANALDTKAEHYQNYAEPRPVQSIARARELAAKIRSALADLNKEIPGLDKLRAEVRTTGTIKRPGPTPGG